MSATKTYNMDRLEQIRAKQLPYTVQPYSTLNEKFLLSHIQPPTSGYPTINYFCIGNKGHGVITDGTGGVPLISILEHNITDSACFNHIPFKAIPASVGLSLSDKNKFRIIILERIGGIDYFMCYLKTMTQTNEAPTTTVVEIQDGVIKSEVEYTPSPTSLTPSPIALSNTTTNTDNGRHLVTQTPYSLALTADDIASIIDAATIKFGSPNYAIISEIGIVSAYDRNESISYGNTTHSYTEVRTAQIMAFIGTCVALQEASGEHTWEFGLSTSQPYPSTT